MKKFILFILFIFLFSSVNAYAIELSAESLCIIEAESGRVIYEKNMNSPMTMASTTKIMTGLLAAESGRWDEMVKISNLAASQEGTSMYLKAGEEVRFCELMYGLLLSSGNDAAVAIGEYLSGDADKFAEAMTERGKKAGATNTTFKNPNGLDEPGHITTACDMAKITAEAMKNERFAEIVGTEEKTLYGRTYTNHNKLLKMYEGVCGVKTGYTKKSGRCLVSACKRDGVMLICVTLNAPDDWNDHMKMYDFGFGNFKKVTIFEKGKNHSNVKSHDEKIVSLVYEKNKSLYLSGDEQKRLEVLNDIPDVITLPVKEGDIIGKVSVVLDGKTLSEVNLVASEDVLPQIEKKSFCLYLYDIVKLWLSHYR